MQKKFFAKLEHVKYRTLSPLLEEIKNSPAQELEELFLPQNNSPELEVKKAMCLPLSTQSEFMQLKNIVLKDNSIKQKIALGIMLANSNNPMVKNFFSEKLQANPISWNKFNGQVIKDRFNNMYRLSIHIVAPLTYYVYFVPEKKSIATNPHPWRDIDNKSLGLALPYDLAGRFIFSTAPDNYGYFPELSAEKQLTISDLKFLIENTALPNSDIGPSFTGLKLYKSFAKLCHEVFPKNTRFFLTDIVEATTIAQLNNGGSFEDTLFGKSFLGAGFNFISQTPCIKPANYEIKTWYGIELLKEAHSNNHP